MKFKNTKKVSCIKVYSIQKVNHNLMDTLNLMGQVGYKEKGFFTHRILGHLIGIL